MKGKNRMLTSDHRQLQDFFILIEKVLLHGLKGIVTFFLLPLHLFECDCALSAPKTLLTFKSPEDLLWAMVQKVGKLTKEAEESVTCIQQLPYVK